MKTGNQQIIRWILPKPINEHEIINFNLNSTLQKVLIRRGIDINDELEEYLTPSELPSAEIHFKELNRATKRLIDACYKHEQIAICGDYDADGITSTVLVPLVQSATRNKHKVYTVVRVRVLTCTVCLFW